MTAVRAGELSELLARKGEALPAARRRGPTSWLDEDSGISEYDDYAQRYNDAPLEDAMIMSTDLANLIRPARAQPKRSLPACQAPLDEPKKQHRVDPLALLLNELDGENPAETDRSRKLFGVGSHGVSRFQQAVGQAAEVQSMRLRRQMTLRLSMKVFERLKDHVETEDITYQKALSEAVSTYLDEVAEEGSS